MFSILLLHGTKIDVNESQLIEILVAIEEGKKIIAIGKRTFASHQYAGSMPKEEADFQEKMDLRKKGFYRCKKYEVIHKNGEQCECKNTGEKNPVLGENQKLLPVGGIKNLQENMREE